AGDALALVQLGHEGDRHALLGRDLLGAVLVDRVLVGRAQGVGVAEVDLVRAEVALALGVLDHHPRRGHAVADPADQGLDAGGAEQGVVDVVEVGRAQGAIALVPGLPGSPSRASWRLRIWRGEATTSEPSSQATSARHITVPSCHGTGRSMSRSGTSSMSL